MIPDATFLKKCDFVKPAVLLGCIGALLVGSYDYEDYTPREPAWYLDRTAYWAEAFTRSGNSR